MGAGPRRVAEAADRARAEWERRPDAKSCGRLARALLAAGAAEQAVAVLARRPEWLERHPSLLALHGRALADCGRTQEAARALARAGDAAWPGAARARAEAIACELAGRTPAQAATDVGRLLLVPSLEANPWVHALHGRLLGRAGRARAAVRALALAAAALPEEGAVAASLAFAVRRADGPRAALPYLMRALTLEPRQPAVLATLVADAGETAHRAAVRRFLLGLAGGDRGHGGLWHAIRRLGADRCGDPFQAGRRTRPERGRGGDAP